MIIAYPGAPEPPLFSDEPCPPAPISPGANPTGGYNRAHMLTRTDVLPLLPKYGLLPVDAYTSAEEPAAVDLGADLMVTESLSFIEGGYHVNATLTDLSKHTKLDEFYANLKEPDWVPNAEPLILRQPADGPAVVIPRVGNSPLEEVISVL